MAARGMGEVGAVVPGTPDGPDGSRGASVPDPTPEPPWFKRPWFVALLVAAVVLAVLAGLGVLTGEADSAPLPGVEGTDT